MNQGVKFLLSLPFVSGNSVTNMSCPSHMYTNIIPCTSDVLVFVGGQLSSEENFAVRKVAISMSIKTESICRANDGTTVQKNYLEAMNRLQEYIRTRKKLETITSLQEYNRARKKWWQFWKAH